MAASGSSMTTLLSAYDLKQACRVCCVQQKEISYTLKSVSHHCARDVLLCRRKGCQVWRPIAKRPSFPNPIQYLVCYYFEEGSGCTYHQNRCTFARSEEEAAVWTFQKRSGLDHTLFCNLIAQSEKGPDRPETAGPLADILAILDLKVVCDLCMVRENEITYTIHSVVHKCSQNQLLVKLKGGSQWRPIAERPTSRKIGNNVDYQVCLFFVEGSGCTQHKSECSFARSYEEATLWNFAKDKRIDVKRLIQLVSESQPVLTPQSAAETLHQQFSGEFVELCNECFNECPQKISIKRWNDKCVADPAHVWNPVLVHYLSEKMGKHVYSQIRPAPTKCPFQYCSHVRDGKPCWHGAGHCQSAQSEVEMAVWKAEHSGLAVRSLLLQLTPRVQTQQWQVSMYCKVCLLSLTSSENFYKHCASLEHAQLLSEDTTIRWRGRQPPHKRRDEFWLCERPQTCEYGAKCPKAHSVEELEEWMMRVEEEKKIRHNMEAQGLMSYNEKLLEEYRSSCNEVCIMSEEVDDVVISCDGDLTAVCETLNKTLTWDFHVETERELEHVALLKQEPGASFSLSGSSSAPPCIYSSGEAFLTEDRSYAITLSFTSINPGMYEQWLVLDFAIRPVLLRRIRVRVGQQSQDETEQPSSSNEVTLQGAERWHRGNRVIIPCSSRTEEQEELLKEYKPPQISLVFKSSKISKMPLNNENYKEQMHQFLYHEENAEDQVVSRLNVCGEIKTMNNLSSVYLETMWAPRGELFCAVSIPCNLTADSPAGKALKRSIRSALIAPLTSNGFNSKVYEAHILPFKINKNKMYLQMSKQCCADLALKHNETCQMQVQFQLDRSLFCNMHKAVDLLPDTKRVLPDLRNCGVPVSNGKHGSHNVKQQAAIDFIIGDSTVKKFVAPLLIYGPFGTGKTYTLAAAARELCKNPHNKVLICTHTNSSADLYVKDHFHPFMSNKNHGLHPIRIKANKQGSAVSATDKITLKYCLRSKDGAAFLPPTKAVLDSHNVVITTTTMARRFHDLKLTEGYFTHILIDEASQMLECESLMALGLAGTNTRVALAGDHMQMGPKLFSVDDHRRSDYTLLTRLFHHYQDHQCDAAQNSRIIFSENYRSTKEIVDFVSTHFYVGKNDVIKATEKVPPPADGHALTFVHVRGECRLDTRSMSWCNKEESAKVVEVLKDILKQWPKTWGVKDPSSICVMSEGAQVQQIRRALPEGSLHGVHVENLANVQGKQFRAVILTAVQTKDSLETCHVPGLELFNDVRVLNTAMTRAQSQVVVVGDAAALCCFGKCSQVWKSFIDHCISNGSVQPKHFTKNFFEKDVMETAKFQKLQHVDESNTLSDAILQELQEEYEHMETAYNAEEDTLEMENMNHQMPISYRTTKSNAEIMELYSKYPDHFVQGMLIRETFKTGFVLNGKTSKRIMIKGRENLGKTFTGDEVVVAVAEAPRVVEITKEAESARELLCTLQDEDYSKPRKTSTDYITRMMVPLSKSETKVCILIYKKMRNYIPIWTENDKHWVIERNVRLDKNLKQNNIFMVRVIGWKETCWFPLGRVTDILPVTGLFNQLRILSAEFNVPEMTWSLSDNVLKADENSNHRQDMRERITFTVDPQGAQDLDDAISVSESENQYELGIHIADVASFVSPGTELDIEVKRKGCTYYCPGQKPNHMFPQQLSTKMFSLLPGQDCRVVSMIFTVEKETNKTIGKPKLQLSLIRSDEQLTYDQAEEIITQRYKDSPKFNEVKDCVAVAYRFAMAQRKRRLVDWQYYQTDDDRKPGRRKAHLMIEELSVLFNTHSADILTKSGTTKLITPLRCQKKPIPEKVEEFRQEYRELIPLSFHVRHRLDHDEQSPSCSNFRILRDMWKEIQAAARAGDLDKMVDIIAADDVHPSAQQLPDQFRRCLTRAYIIRSNSCSDARVGHYDLNVLTYTQASSPIRRYMDLVLQRLLHSVICQKEAQYTEAEITALCVQSEKELKNAKTFQQKAEQVVFAMRIKEQSTSKLAFVVVEDAKRDSLSLSFPFNKNILSSNLCVMYRDLQLEDQPEYGKNHNVTLKWKRRIYAADTMKIHRELKMATDSDNCIELPMSVWKVAIEALSKGKLDDVRSIILDAGERHVVDQPPREIPDANKNTSEKTPESMVEIEHWVDIDLQLQPGDMLQTQITSQIHRGSYIPIVQLVSIKPNFEICVEHVHNPIACFSQAVDRPTQVRYDSIEEYLTVWRPLCDMESVYAAVDESEGIIIENLEVQFIQSMEGQLTGSFSLSLQWLDEWAIEFSLAKCLLCIRKRGLTLPSPLEHSATVDPPEFTWVAHGVTTAIDKQRKDGIKVKFLINHLPMQSTPKCVFDKNTAFTVEIIPRLLPDRRKEAAVINVPNACGLVQNIALGKFHSNMGNKHVRIVMEDPTKGQLRELNEIQRLALSKALNNTLTLIQGPPGTGKTIVGVHMLFHLFERNSKSPRKPAQKKEEDKKQVILYCGPSNKSVDVVAEYVIKFADQLKPLRVYSSQMEKLDYPSPDANLQPHHKRRPDKAKPELRRISLHHRMRDQETPFSARIQDFDRRIRNALEGKGKRLTAEEVKECNELLREARAYELKRHDIILCTCTASSTPSLTNNVSARQIIIDECAMATEPQTMIPLVCNQPEKIVLIGDHKQLRPIVKEQTVKKLGITKSLFERIYELFEKNCTVMLDTQYRMHEDICSFPSREFYRDKLKTALKQPASVLHVNRRTMPIVFGDIKGKTVSLVVSTAKGNENSKANREERSKVVEIAENLVRTAKIQMQSIVILSPYNAQVSEIRDILKRRDLEEITVTTITKSQGSEWRYVLISTVCSLPSDQMEEKPDGAWLSKHLGFVGDPNQTNVAITRAKEGLCIIGDQELLSQSQTWRHLLNHFRQKNAVVNADQISVQPR